MANLMVRREIEIARRLSRSRRWIDVDLEFDPDRLRLARSSKRQVELARDGIILDQRLADCAVHLRLGQRIELQPELAEHLGQRLEIGGPVEPWVGFAQQEVEILGEARQAMEDAQGRATLEEGDVEEVTAPQSVERDLLQDFLDRVLFLERVGGVVAAQLLLDDINHRLPNPSWP